MSILPPRELWSRGRRVLRPGHEARFGVVALGAGALVFVLAIVLSVRVVGDDGSDVPLADGPSRTPDRQAVVAPVLLTPADPVVVPAVDGAGAGSDTPADDQGTAADGGTDAAAGGGAPEPTPTGPTTPTAPSAAPTTPPAETPVRPEPPDPEPPAAGGPGPVSALAAPVVAGVTGLLDTATGGATAPLTGAVTGVTDAVTGLADGLLGGPRPGRG